MTNDLVNINRRPDPPYIGDSAEWPVVQSAV